VNGRSAPRKRLGAASIVSELATERIHQATLTNFPLCSIITIEFSALQPADGLKEGASCRQTRPLISRRVAST
jgi:hypothetical protein